MDGIANTEDRETFEREIFRPPHLARLLDISGEFIGRLDKQDREYFLYRTMGNFWESRAGIKVMNDISRLWVAALQQTANERLSWEIWSGVEWRWVRPGQLRRKS